MYINSIIFKQWEQLLAYKKTQHRIPVKPEHIGQQIRDEYREISQMFFAYKISSGFWMRSSYGYPRPLYHVGYSYWIVPHRAAKPVGRIRITRIRQQNIQSIGSVDARAEGFNSIAEFAKFWDRGKYRDYRWKANPRVWVLEFELVERFES